jgi:hypothetical protein
MGNDESVLWLEVLRRRAHELERDIWVTEASIEASSGSTQATNRIEILRWKREELRAINAAIAILDERHRPVPSWMIVISVMTGLTATLIAGWALWMQLYF